MLDNLHKDMPAMLMFQYKIMVFDETSQIPLCLCIISDERLTMLDNLHKDLYKDMPAMFIYTSGTTGRPKVCVPKLCVV